MGLVQAQGGQGGVLGGARGRVDLQAEMPGDGGLAEAVIEVRSGQRFVRVIVEQERRERDTRWWWPTRV